MIVATLVLQGLTLPALIRVLRISDDGGADREDAKARIKAAEAALARLEELVAEGAVRPQTAERLRGAFGFRRDRFRARLDDGDDGAIEEQSLAYQRVMRELLDAERAALLALRNDRVIDDNVMQRVQRDLDLEAARLDLLDLAHDREHNRDDGEHDDAVREDLRQIGRRQRLAEAQRSLVAPQPVVATERQARSEDDRDDGDEVRATPLDDLREGEPARDQRERRPVPGEESALVREGEPGIRIGSAVIGVGVTRAILRVGLGAHATVSGCSALRLDLGEVVPLELVLRERRQPAGLATHLATPLLLATGLGGMQGIREAPFER